MTNISDINLNRLVVFVAIVETGSLTAAAKRLGITKTMASTHLQRLEAEIGSQLLVRTTRSQLLTETGYIFYESCQKILQDTEAAIGIAKTQNRELTGKLRISCPIEFGDKIVAPIAAKLSRTYRALKINIISSDHRADLVAEGIDLSIRIGRLDDSSHRAKLIAPFNEWITAAPNFFGASIPNTLEDLQQFPLVSLTALTNPTYWRFTKLNQPSVTLRFQSNLSANTSGGVRSATLNGGGFMILPDLYVKEDVEKGNLIRVLADWQLPGGGIYAVFPNFAQRPAKVSLFIEEIKKSLNID
jgi:DNA-binding transcriptional LysR family regulator